MDRGNGITVVFLGLCHKFKGCLDDECGTEDPEEILGRKELSNGGDDDWWFEVPALSIFPLFFLLVLDENHLFAGTGERKKNQFETWLGFVDDAVHEFSVRNAHSYLVISMARSKTRKFLNRNRPRKLTWRT